MTHLPPTSAAPVPRSPLCNLARAQQRFAEKAGKQIGLAVLGSTGSIGKSCLELVRRFPERFRVESLAAGGGQPELLAKQIAEFKPRYVAVAGSERLDKVRSLIPHQQMSGGSDAVVEAAEYGDVVLAGISGIAGLRSTVRAVERGAIVALANKESVVCGADILEAALRKSASTSSSSAAGQSLSDSGGGVIIPVDSEHSSLAQLLWAVRDQSELESLVLTASGGPFLRTPLAELHAVTPEQAVKHPRWSMGAKISIDSATLVNKALEWFETVYLFGCSNVEVVIHPQSIIHGLVGLRDGAMLANLSYPDMQLPIGYAIGLTERLPKVLPRLSLQELQHLTFEAVDSLRFPALQLAQRAYEAHGVFGSAVYSLANERAVAEFMRGNLPFPGITPYIEQAISRAKPRSLSTLEALEDLFPLSGTY